jgi:hypothetical protein
MAFNVLSMIWSIQTWDASTRSLTFRTGCKWFRSTLTWLLLLLLGSTTTRRRHNYPRARRKPCPSIVLKNCAKLTFHQSRHQKLHIRKNIEGVVASIDRTGEGVCVCLHVLLCSCCRELGNCNIWGITLHHSKGVLIVLLT